MMFRNPCVLLLCLAMLGAAAPVFAQNPVALGVAIPTVAQAKPPAQQPADAVPSSQAAEQLEKARANLARLSDLAIKAKDDDNSLAELKVEVDATAKQIVAASSAAGPRLDQIKARLAELGDAPAEGAPPEAAAVTQERDRLLSERNDINALTGNAETLADQATKLSNSITATRRELFSNTLLRHTDINPDVLKEAASTVLGERDALFRTVGSWLVFVWSFKRVALLSALFSSLCVALVLFAGTRRLFAPLIRRNALNGDPSYISRLSVAFWSTMVPTFAMMAFAATSYFFLQTLNVLRPDIAPLVSTMLGIAVALLFVWTLANAVLAPTRPAWRLVRVSNRGARLLVFSIVAMMVVNCLDYLTGTVSEVLGSPIVLTVVKSLTATVIFGLILIAMPLIRPIVPAGEPLDSHGKPWPRFVSMLFLTTGVLLIVAALSGYVGMGRFIATQIVVTGAVIVAMYIGILTGKAVAKQNALAETVVGRYLVRRFKLGQVGLDQAGLAAGLAIYALVILFFFPLILLRWGFQIADIEAGAYRFFTEIRIGSITISIVGILAGVGLFGIGYAITRWFQRWLDGSVMARSRVDAGVRNSVKTGIGYLGIGTAGLVAISAAGLDLSSLALVAGALSLGVGFGLQNIVSNFVSGLILLVERPFKVGDWVVTGTTEGFVKRISVRATEIETFQRQTIMVPNSLFINASVGNWTHRNKLGRSDISVMVGYNTAPRRVIELLLDIAEQHPLVLKNPEPLAVFSAFGETTMTFELRVYLADIVNGNGVRNDLRLSIFERFHDEGIGAPFPPQVLAEAELAPLPGDESAQEPVEEPGPDVDVTAADVAKRGGTTRRPRRITAESVTKNT